MRVCWLTVKMASSFMRDCSSLSRGDSSFRSLLAIRKPCGNGGEEGEGEEGERGRERRRSRKKGEVNQILKTVNLLLSN